MGRFSPLGLCQKAAANDGHGSPAANGHFEDRNGGLVAIELSTVEG
jgi:hypothetical protein